MFDRPGPRVFGLPPGADFPKELLLGLEKRLAGHPPEAWAKVEIFVNTRRMQRRLVSLFDKGPARLLPRIRLVTDMARISGLGDLPPAIPPLRRRLELSQLVAGLLAREPDLAPSAAIFDLADSLAGLMDEMQGEGVAPEVLHNLDVSHLSEHWERTRSFLTIVEQFFGTDGQDGLDGEARNRRAAEFLVKLWETSPPQHPIIVAGSTGSRGATALFMEAVARLPQGAVILPGFDFDQPDVVWDALDDAMTAEDHPQFRFRKLMTALGISRPDVDEWNEGSPAPNPARNRLISLALRPAPVTDQWLTEGRDLTEIAAATADMTLIEAPSPRAEAMAIALRLRQAAEDGITAALITPDRMLTRQVTAALDRWGIEPDDSAGLPLQLSAPGRFFRHIAALFGQKLTAEALLTLLKHPLTSSTPGLRGNHLLWTRELELYIRRNGPPFPTGHDLISWAEKNDDGRMDWAIWLADILTGLDTIQERPLSDHLTQHIALSEALAAGPSAEGSGGLWDKPAGKEAHKAVTALVAEAGYGGDLSPRDYGDLFRAVLGRHEVHDPIQPHARIMIWGTLEARVQGADLVILGGLNEGSWPSVPPPDPWLNREMRRNTGLLLPERRIGLAAHDFQQAIGAKEVFLTRAVRDAEAETVPSRWLNRLTNLLNGLPNQGGDAALKNMRAKGAYWLSVATALEEPASREPSAQRPSPCPPVTARPNKLSVTRIQTLIRDPYAIYARYILNLNPLDALRQEPDAPLRGTILHKVFEEFIRHGVDQDPEVAKHQLLSIADQVFAESAPWPAARRMWRARLARVADWFLLGEAERQVDAHWIALERKGSVSLQNGFELTAEADRIDQRTDGTLVIYDYKTGSPPSKKQMEEYDKQLLLEAAMAARGGFKDLAAGPVAQVAYIGLGPNPKFDRMDLPDGMANETWANLGELIEKYRQPERGYTARRASFRREDASDYDHLSRYGEWNESLPPSPEEVGE
ncbi:double-strand break repair protein AddB [Actibacterium lipolyticum]|uniref:PD-(D/E)XK nuclease superfamily protein n=1 Tax=Actibacterium lipolyticum TaxID=1524263 RepID=A0A238KWZ8_9RHOB|nr:double-strand break repair protein AddB [Actibacterium lipolyticum]SMX47150.1 PD-(D/E)XK nuclease superfamily protein [Actibacterium lipolyticum]